MRRKVNSLPVKGKRFTVQSPKALLAFLSGDGRREVAVVQPLDAFLDESGTHAGAAILSVGACVGTHKQWRNFLKLWKEPHFHSKEQFRPLKPGLLQVITESRLRCFVAIVEPRDYRRDAGVRLKAGLGNAYVACLVSCVVAICGSAKRPVAFAIEDGPAEQRMGAESYTGNGVHAGMERVHPYGISRQKEWSPAASCS